MDPAVPIDFALPDQDGDNYRLSEHLAQPMAVLFYRGDW